MYKFRSIGLPAPCRERLDWLAAEAGLFVSRGPHQGKPSRARLLQDVASRRVRLVATDGGRIPAEVSDYSIPFSINLPASDWQSLEEAAAFYHADSWRSLVRLIGDGAFDLVLPGGRIINALDMPDTQETRGLPGLRAASYA